MPMFRGPDAGTSLGRKGLKFFGDREKKKKKGGGSIRAQSPSIVPRETKKGGGKKGGGGGRTSRAAKSDFAEKKLGTVSPGPLGWQPWKEKKKEGEGRGGKKKAGRLNPL